jgi:hypothetical protein
MRYVLRLILVGIVLAAAMDADLNDIHAQPPGEYKGNELKVTEPIRDSLPQADQEKPVKEKPVEVPLEQILPQGVVALNPQKTIWLDKAGHKLYLVTKVVQKNGPLEMFCCLKQTKEHESILSLDGKAAVVHAGLLALGIEPGKHVQFDPDFVPPTGTELNIDLIWTDPQGKKQHANVHDWIQTSTRRYFTAKLTDLSPDVKFPEDDAMRFDKKYEELMHFGVMTEARQKEYLQLSTAKDYQAAIKDIYTKSQPRKMVAKFVFAGSKLYEDPDTKEKFYLAEEGDLICVANFVSATIDVAMKSSASASELSYEAVADKVPALGTRVVIELSKMTETKATEKPKLELKPE